MSSSNVIHGMVIKVTFLHFLSKIMKNTNLAKNGCIIELSLNRFRHYELSS